MSITIFLHLSISIPIQSIRDREGAATKAAHQMVLVMLEVMLANLSSRRRHKEAVGLQTTECTLKMLYVNMPKQFVMMFQIAISTLIAIPLWRRTRIMSFAYMLSQLFTSFIFIVQ